jgi:hypothetical protein
MELPWPGEIVDREAEGILSIKCSARMPYPKLKVFNEALHVEYAGVGTRSELEATSLHHKIT